MRLDQERELAVGVCDCFDPLLERLHRFDVAVAGPQRVAPVEGCESFRARIGCGLECSGQVSLRLRLGGPTCPMSRKQLCGAELVQDERSVRSGGGGFRERS